MKKIYPSSHLYSEEEIKKLQEETFTSLSVYIRDTTKSKDIILEYILNDIIEEVNPFYVRSSSDGFNNDETLRYIILSNHVEKTNEAGTFLVNSNSHFKILSIESWKGKACIILLHLPAKNWPYFYNNMELIDDIFVNYALLEFHHQTDTNYDSSTRSPLYMSTNNKSLGIIKFYGNMYNHGHEE